MTSWMHRLQGRMSSIQVSFPLLAAQLGSTEWLLEDEVGTSQSHALLPFFLALRTFPGQHHCPGGTAVTFAHPRAETQSVSVGCKQLPHGSPQSPCTCWSTGQSCCASHCPQGGNVWCSQVGPSSGCHSAKKKKEIPRSQPGTALQEVMAKSLSAESSLKPPKKKEKTKNEYMLFMSIRKQVHALCWWKCER